MYRKAIAYCANLTLCKVLVAGIVLAVAIEAVTILLRFGMDLESTRDTSLIGAVTFSLRIHHGYVGIAMWFAATWLFRSHPGLRNIFWFIAAALFLSDLVHHFGVLWPITGSPEFDLVYPQMP